MEQRRPKVRETEKMLREELSGVTGRKIEIAWIQAAFDGVAADSYSNR